MAYADLLAKRPQDVGYMLRISGIKYYWVSHADVPTLTDSKGGTAYTRVEGAFLSAPRGMPMKAHPLQQPSVLSTTIELIDIDDALTDIFATERDTPRCYLTGSLTAAATSINVSLGSDDDGLQGFDSAGFCYIDNECIEYTSYITGPPTINGGVVRGKFAEGLTATAAAHSQWMLADSKLDRPVFGYLPHMWQREVRLDIYDLENTSNTTTIARGYLQEPQWVGEEIFRFRIMNGIFPLQRNVFRRSECRGRLTQDFMPPLAVNVNIWGTSTAKVKIADPYLNQTETLVIESKGTPEIDPDDAFLTNANIPAVSDLWMPAKMMYVLVGGDDGEILGVNDWDSATGELTVICRGCFGTRTGGDNPLGLWEKDTPVQFLCALAGDPAITRQKDKSYAANDPTSIPWQSSLYTDQLSRQGELTGVNPVEAFLMLATSIAGDGTNGTWDLLPEYYGLEIDDALIDTSAFAGASTSFKELFCSDRQHLYIGAEPKALLPLVVADLQALYGGMIYAKQNGQISIAHFRHSIPSDTLTTVAEEDIKSVDTIGVSEIFNTLKYSLDAWPSVQEQKVTAYDYRRRDAIGESPAPGVQSESLRGIGYTAGLKRFTGESIVRGNVTNTLQMLGNGAPAVEMYLTAKHLDLEPGNFISFTHTGPPQIIANSRGFSGQKALVLEVQPEDDEAQVRIRALLVRDINTALWAPSAEISSVTDQQQWIVKAAVFNADDRQSAYWATGTKIRVWNAAMTAFDQLTVDTYNSTTGEIVTTAVSPNSYVVVDNRITWDDWDTCRAGGSTQQARCVTAIWYAWLCDSNENLGTNSDPAQVWL